MNALTQLFLGRVSGRRRINRVPSPFLARGIPWLSVMAFTVLPVLILIASAPVCPPLGFLVLIAWHQLRPGLLPLWAGLPLGLFDDLYSGQPLGSGVLLWSMAVIVLDLVEAQLPWRNFVMEWLVAAALIVAYIAISLGFANLAGAATGISAVMPQIALSVLIYPLVGRMVAGLDRFRLIPFVELG